MNWYFDKDELRRTPSVQDGVPFMTECQYRHEGARFVIDAGTKMDLDHNTMATGVVFFQRFYMFHSFKSFPGHLTACCCLFLAGKVEETPKKCRDIIKMAKALLPKDKYQTFGSDPKKEMMILEKILLQTIKFDLQVDHPYQFLTKYAKCLKGDETKRTKMVQMAWKFVNDSLCTTLCVQWEPEIIAISLIQLASKLSNFEVYDWEGRTPNHLFWWDMFVNGLSVELLENIGHQVLDIYSFSNKTTPLSSLATLPFNRDGAFVGDGFDIESQHFENSGQHYVDSGSQHYPDSVNQQLRENTFHRKYFNNQDNPRLFGLPQCQNRQIRKRPYQKQ